MENSFLVQLMQRLEPEELDRFALYLHSPYFNRGQLPVRLFEFLRARVESQTDKPLASIAPEEASNVLYPGQEYVAQRLRRVRMELTHHLENFLALEATPFAPKQLIREFALRKQLLDKGLLELYEKRIRKKPVETSHYQVRETLVEIFLKIQHNEYFIHAGKPDDTLEDAISSLDQFYLGLRLELSTSMINKERIYKRKHTYSFPNLISEMVSSSEALEWDNVHLWQNVYQLHFPETGPRSFSYLNDFLAARKELLPPPQLRQIRGFMLNYINRTIESKEKYLQIWDLLKKMLEEGTLYSHGKINANMFRAVIRSACYSGSVDWAEDFLESYGPLLKGEEPKEQLELFGAMVSFFSGRTQAALGKVNRIHFRSDRDETYLKALQLMCTYKLKQEDDFFRLGDAFRKYLTDRKGMGDRFNRLYYEFNHQLNRMGKVKFYGKTLPSKLEDDILKNEVAEKIWLLQELEELQ